MGQDEKKTAGTELRKKRKIVPKNLRTGGFLLCETLQSAVYFRSFAAF